jgi:hypothetical protein
MILIFKKGGFMLPTVSSPLEQQQQNHVDQGTPSHEQDHLKLHEKLPQNNLSNLRISSTFIDRGRTATERTQLIENTITDIKSESELIKSTLMTDKSLTDFKDKVGQEDMKTHKIANGFFNFGGVLLLVGLCVVAFEPISGGILIGTGVATMCVAKIFMNNAMNNSVGNREYCLTYPETKRLENRKRTLENVLNLSDQSDFEKYLNTLTVNEDEGIKMIDETRVYDIDKMDKLIDR